MSPNNGQTDIATIERHIDDFRRAVKAGSVRLPCVQIAADAICIAQDLASVQRAMDPGGKIHLTILAVVHGNEVGGLAIVTKLLNQILSGAIRLQAPIGIALGNTEAALLGRRFIERDLNRSFGAPANHSREAQRAHELEDLLARSQFLLDIHQTHEPSESAFFIFPWQRKSFDFARRISRELPVVTHWAGAFSKDGMCSDEFVNAKGGTGITLELGQAGFDEDQIAIGLACSLQALETTGSADVGGTKPHSNLPNKRHNNLHKKLHDAGAIYTWNGIIPYPPTGDVALVPGLINFQMVAAGDLIAKHDGLDIFAPVSGRILFPKYVRPGSPEFGGPRPAELCRIMKTITEEELPS